MSVTTARTRPSKGVSLTRVPALALGTFLVIAGLYFIYKEHGFPPLSQFPNGTAHVNGKAFFSVFGLNGWSGELTVAGGALLMIGAAQHTLAKTAAFIVAVVFAGVGIWALVNHHSALGLFAANIWTELLWFAAAAYLLVITMLPRVGGETTTATTSRSQTVTTEPTGRTTAAAPVAGTTAGTTAAPERTTEAPVVRDTGRAGAAGQDVQADTTQTSRVDTAAGTDRTQAPAAGSSVDPARTPAGEEDTVVHPATPSADEAGTTADDAGTTEGSLRRPNTNL